MRELNSKTQAEIMSALGEMVDAYSCGDATRIASMYAPDGEVVAFGPAVGEKWIGRDQIGQAYAREFSNFPDSNLEFVWASIAGSGKTAWVAADCRAHVPINGSVLLIDGRFTAVLERVGPRWVIAQSHFSFPTAF